MKSGMRNTLLTCILVVSVLLNIYTCNNLYHLKEANSRVKYNQFSQYTRYLGEYITWLNNMIENNDNNINYSFMLEKALAIEIYSFEFSSSTVSSEENKLESLSKNMINLAKQIVIMSDEEGLYKYPIDLKEKNRILIEFSNNLLVLYSKLDQTVKELDMANGNQLYYLHQKSPEISEKIFDIVQLNKSLITKIKGLKMNYIENLSWHVNIRMQNFQ